ncbi:zinc finger CCCH domain-containing protein 67-like [Salvia splendens]|uniref:zinc finger CCCH domain-containing protein 67-like n=1 Tax=Salvia splendens TaxID=180675 RepID=UPI001C2730F9|nr:zinc finger CCCH domain-containing protein 67-like [Salvia splendens]
MAESPPSTSEKPPIQKVGLGFLLEDKPLSDPINPEPEFPEHAPGGGSDPPKAELEEVLGETAVLDEEMEYLNAIERELCELTIQQAHIEGVSEILLSIDKEEGDDAGKQNDGNDSESFEGGNDIDEGDADKEGNVAVNFGDGASKFGRFNQNNSRRRINYPMRPDAEDCAFYMKFGSCKFGLNCKFNHPPRRKNQNVKERTNHREENSGRGGQTECKYYLTSAGCKYGKDCKYSHGSDRSSTSQTPEFNFLGLPIRIGEKECPYYMRTGSCKYGLNCRFHHPEPVTVGDSSSGYGNGGSFPSQFVSSPSPTSWSSPRAFNENSPFVPVMFPPSPGAPTSNQDWNGYQAATYSASEGLPTPPAFSLNNLPAEINFPMRRQPDILVEEYPERPGEPECSFFIKTGDCKFRSNCKFHHPKSCVFKGKPNTYTLSDKGLPLRPDQPICTHYHRYGICKYGPACKYDHPSNFAILPTPFDQPAVMLEQGNESLEA